MRDALSLLDQVLSLTGGEVDVESVRRVLGLVEEERYLELLAVLREGRHEAVFGLVQGLVDDGYDLVEFYHGLLDVFRALLRLRLSSDAEVDVRDDVREQLVAHASAFEAGDLVRMLSAAAELESQGSLRRSPNPRLPIEMLLLKISFLDRTVDLEALIRAMGGAPPPDGSAGGGGAPAAGSPDDAGASGGGGSGSGGDPRAAASGADDSPSAAPVAPAEAKAAEAQAPAAIVPSATAQAAWRSWLDDGRTVPRGLAALLRAAAFEEAEDGTLTISSVESLAAERLRERRVLDQVRHGLAPYLGRVAEIVVRESGEEQAPARRVTQEEVREDTLKALFRQEPRLERAVEELDLELME